MSLRHAKRAKLKVDGRRSKRLTARNRKSLDLLIARTRAHVLEAEMLIEDLEEHQCKANRSRVQVSATA